MHRKTICKPKVLDISIDDLKNKFKVTTNPDVSQNIAQNIAQTEKNINVNIVKKYLNINQANQDMKKIIVNKQKIILLK